MVTFEMSNKLLEVFKSVHIASVLPVTEPTEDLQALLSTARMTLEMLPDLLASSDPPEVAELAFDPGEGLQVGEGAREDNFADLVFLDTKMFQLVMPEDVLYSLVVVPVLQAAEPAGECEAEVTDLDVTLSGLSDQSLPTVGAGHGEDTPR